MRFLKDDLRPGGQTHFEMTAEQGTPSYGRAEYREIIRPRLIVYAQQFCDEKLQLARHHLMPLWPLTLLTTVVFTPEGPHQTRVTLTWQPEGQITGPEGETFLKARGGMTQGWTGSFDQLENLLQKQGRP